MSTKKLTRRDFIRQTTLVVGGAVLAACTPATLTSAPTTPPTTVPVKPTDVPIKPTDVPKPAATVAPTEGPVVLQWWDHQVPLQPLHKKLFATYTKDNPNVSVVETTFNPAEMGKALQLAYPNKQAPDVHTLAGVSLPPSALIKEGWFAPLDPFIDDAWKKLFPDGSFNEGVNVFSGKIYSFPIFTFRQYLNITWYNKKLIADAGLDPAKDFTTWDSVRASVKKITDKGKGQVFGWIEGISFVDRMGQHMLDIASAAGAPGEIDFKTGEYQYATDPFVNGIDWWVSMAKDGSLHPTSTTLDQRNARVRWVAGAGGIFFDGPWNPGSVLAVDKTFMDNLGVLPCPTPSGKPAIIGRGPNEESFWISAQSKNPKHGAGLLKQMISDEYQMGLAEMMDTVPLSTSAVAKANVHPTYVEQTKFFANSVHLDPQPKIRNSLVNDVVAEMKAIHPNLGEIIQGAITGDVKDIKKVLKDFNDGMTKERDRAIKVVLGKGGKISVDDWVFSDWTPGKDYQTKPNA